MSSLSANTVPETITPTDRARDSPMITSLHDDSYMLVRQAYTPIATDIESEPFEDPIETEETQPLSLRETPLGPDYTPASSDYTHDTPHLDEDTIRMIVRTKPTLSSGFSARVTEAMNLSQLSFRKRYGSSYETPSLSASPASSLTLHLRKRYWGTSNPILDTETEGDESETDGTNSKTADEPLVLRYGAARRHALKLAEGYVPSTFKVGTDNANITRKRSKPDKHEHKNGKSAQEPGV
ncbi:hypothetical protein Tco_1324331 [Tanacetum coccineum]